MAKETHKYILYIYSKNSFPIHVILKVISPGQGYSWTLSFSSDPEHVLYMLKNIKMGR